MKIRDLLRKYKLGRAKKEDDENLPRTLRDHALKRAMELDKLNAGTPYDWEDFERYRKSLNKDDPS
ncbi:MAG: peptidase S14 [Pseudomonadota bacterium]|nr:peptidase S14 [Pseudomonadota bacterium]